MGVHVVRPEFGEVARYGIGSGRMIDVDAASRHTRKGTVRTRGYRAQRRVVANTGEHELRALRR